MIKARIKQKNNYFEVFESISLIRTKFFYSFNKFYQLLFCEILKRTVRTVVIFFVVLNLNKLPIANAGDYTSAIAINANTGEVLYSYRPDLKIYPASLTKMMTSYLVFETVNKGIIGLNDDVVDKKTIKDLLLKMIVNSDNVSTIKLANEINSDYNDFISEMNNKAKKMNMSNTHFANATGLFDEKHYSTARDMAKLAIRLVYDFPQYMDIFETTNYIDENGEYNTKTSTIHQNVKGLKGGKTGYISASGYNLAVWGDYDGKKIFIVMIGADSKYSRDENILKILKKVSQKTSLDTKLEVKDNTTMLSKMFNFVGLDYNIYTAQKPFERGRKTADEVKLEQNKNNEINTEQKNKVSYFYKNVN